jgi:hypothetical protein
VPKQFESARKVILRGTLVHHDHETARHPAACGFADEPARGREGTEPNPRDFSPLNAGHRFRTEPPPQPSPGVPEEGAERSPNMSRTPIPSSRTPGTCR